MTIQSFSGSRWGLNKCGPAVSGLDSSSTSAASSGTGSAETKAAEKTVFDIKLEKFDAAAKIKEAKDLVKKAPVVVKKGVTKEEGNSIVEKLQGLGATVVLE
ncbi:ribosomal protein L12 family protein [Actinidia rufa]|uniref:Ribosomal protein L12 family protein n=1 Tax=Actinidia rufa TaxID=165716 RepID=A0A7J0FLE2_9ERIC|nr:ribosomal protein L12 family protein [Actinidia rufa]